MELLNKIFLTVFLCAGLIGFAGCGVKGSPLPPLNPAPIGRGEPTYSEATQKSSKDKKRTYRNQELEERNSSETQEGL